MKRLTNFEVARVAAWISGLRLERDKAYGVHLGRDGVYRANETPFCGDPVGALALNRAQAGLYVASTADWVLSKLLGRKITKGFCPGVSAGFIERPPVSKADDYLAGYELGRALWRDGGDRALMREHALARVQRRKAEERRAFFGY